MVVLKKWQWSVVWALKGGWWPKAGTVVVKKGGGDGSGSLSGDGCCGLCTYALSCKKS